MSIDRKKFGAIKGNPDVTFMNVIGKEKNKLDVVEHKGKKQFGTKAYDMPLEIIDAVTIPAVDGGNPNRQVESR